MDGCYSFEKNSDGQKTTEQAKFHKLSSPTNTEVKELLDRIVDKVLKPFERSGFVIIRKGELISNTDTENNDLVNVEYQHDQDGDCESNTFQAIQAGAFRSKEAVGPAPSQPVQKVKTIFLQDYAEKGRESNGPRCFQSLGFSIHANVSIAANKRDRL